MPEVIWKAGAETDLLQIFADLEVRRESSDEQFVRRLNVTLEHVRANPEIAPVY